jgi:hypothetical protein
MINLRLTAVEAQAAWHALSTTVRLIDAVDVPVHAPLYGQRARLIAIAQRLDHEINSQRSENGPV